MRRLVAVSWAMPPMLFPRAIQVSRLLKQLCVSGWHCTVVSLQPSDEVEGGINDIELAEYYAGTYKQIMVDTSKHCVKHPATDVMQNPATQFWRRRRLTDPDGPSAKAWVDSATKVAVNQIRAENGDILITFAQPWIDHLVGLRLRMKFWRLPWIAHFSDPWADSPYAQYASAKERAVERKREARVIRWADELVFVTERTAELVMRKYPARYRAKVHILPHGFDAEVLTAATPNAKSSCEGPNRRLKLVFTGQFLSGKRTPDGLLQALNEMKHAGELDDSKLELTFVGEALPGTVSLIESLDLTDVVRIVPRVAYMQSLREAAVADVLVLIDAPSNNSVFLPSKFVDYLMMQKPILGLTPASGAVADIMDELSYPLVEPTDVAGIRAALLETIRKWQNGCLTKSPQHQEIAQRYDIRNVAIQFSKLADAAIIHRRRRGAVVRWLVGRPRPITMA